MLWWLLWKKQATLHEEETILKYGSTYLEIRTTSRFSLLYNVFYTLRRLYFILLATLFSNSPTFQV